MTVNQNPKSREHITAVCLSVSHYLGVNKLSAQFEVGKHAAVLLALNEGLHTLAMISDEDYKLLDRRYRRKLRDIIAQNQVKRENTRTPVLALEQHKESKMLEEKDRIFKGILDQWGIHEDPKWRLKVVAEAERFQDKLESARRILELQGQSETVTVPPTVTVESSAYSPENSDVEGAVPAQEPGDQTT